jgi:hypothetical protein
MILKYTEPRGLDDEDEDEVIHLEATGLVGSLAILIGLVILVLLPFATHGQPDGKPWFLSPRILPATSALAILFGGIAIALHFRVLWSNALHKDLFWRKAFSGFDGLRSALIYSAAFLIYVFALNYVGFALSSLAFGQFCLWRAGLRSRKWVIWNLVFCVLLVVVLRVLMGLWFPQAPVMQYLPDWFANGIGTYL